MYPTNKWGMKKQGEFIVEAEDIADAWIIFVRDCKVGRPTTTCSIKPIE